MNFFIFRVFRTIVSIFSNFRKKKPNGSVWIWTKRVSNCKIWKRLGNRNRWRNGSNEKCWPDWEWANWAAVRTIFSSGWSTDLNEDFVSIVWRKFWKKFPQKLYEKNTTFFENFPKTVEWNTILFDHNLISKEDIIFEIMKKMREKIDPPENMLQN